jgi:hypothetical protein
MKRWWLLSAVGAMSAVVLLQLSRPDPAPASPQADRSSGTAEAQPLPAVRVEQRLVEADLVEAPQPETGVVAAPASVSRAVGTSGGTAWVPPRAASVSSTRSQQASATSPMFERAKRAFLGDGRHRPQPFPRVKDN